jgi:pimeloyl-ACP methyl ester carboxylesterase
MPTLKVTGSEIHYLDVGRGPSAVVLLHAFPLHLGMWSRQVESLSQRHRVVALDYRGLGSSGPPRAPSTMDLLAEDVGALCAHLRVERAGVAGLSMGGYLAFEVWRRMPRLVRGLALCDTRAGPDTPEGAAGRETFARNALEKGLSWVADEMTPKLLRPDPDPAAVKEVRDLVAAGTPAGVAMAQRGMASRPDSFPTLATITVPTVIIVGEQDGLTPPAESERMLAGIAGATLVRIARAGHLPCIENPGPFTAALVAWADGLPA